MKTQVTNSNSYAANRTVEITVWLIGLIVLALLLTTGTANASEFQFEDEAYVDDIPFDTEMVVHFLTNSDFNFEEEAYVDDIPFNTADISRQWLFEEAMMQKFDLNEEAYVNDLPFDTEQVAANYQFRQAMDQVYEMTEENYVNDIPFNTCLIAAKAMNGNNHEVYASTR
jgi:hypothetical protein